MAVLKISLVLVGILAVGELFARYVLGLGDPPLFRPDAQCEYLYVPGEYHRFGNTIHYNSYSMRASTDAPKSNGEYRVVVCGDSIVNGTAHVSDEKLATSLLQIAMSQDTDGPISVLNISACSWGPANLVGYFRKYGFFNADFIFIVLNGDDAFDMPAMNSSQPYPESRPICALLEGVQLLWIRLAGAHLSNSNTNKGTSEKSIRELVSLLRVESIPFAVVLHWSETEAKLGKAPGVGFLKTWVSGNDIIDMKSLYLSSLGSVWRSDGMHLNTDGQAVLAQALFEYMLSHKDRIK